MLDKTEFEMITKLHEEFKEAIEGTAGMSLAGDANVSNASAGQAGATPPRGSALKQVLAKRLGGVGSTGNKGPTMQEITEEDEP